MSGTRKKVVVRQQAGELHFGYLPAANFLTAESHAANDAAAEALNMLRKVEVLQQVEVLLVDGRVLPLRLAEVKHIAYVRNFNLDDREDPERLGMRAFLSRPRGSGVWVRVHFPEGDTLEGLVPAGLPFLDSLLLERGLFLEPPDRAGNTQRLFIPRASLIGFEVLGVAGRASTVRRHADPQPPRQQGALFAATGED